MISNLMIVDMELRHQLFGSFALSERKISEKYNTSIIKCFFDMNHFDGIMHARDCLKMVIDKIRNKYKFIFIEGHKYSQKYNDGIIIEVIVSNLLEE